MICVAGMPRSGTSMITQLLHRCGVNLGPPEQLMPASINNTDGFWENLRFVRLNERLLAASGGRLFQFAAARGGNVAMTFGLATLPIIGGVGAAIDFGHAHAVKSAMQSA